MLQSMTGYGKASYTHNGKKVVVEIRTLNSKQADIITKLPVAYREREIELRNQVAACVERGKVDVSLRVELTGDAVAAGVNRQVFEAYYCWMKEQSAALGISLEKEPVFATILRLPDVMTSSAEEVEAAEWQLFQGAVDEALRAVTAYRSDEGAVLEADILGRVAKIESLLEQVAPFEQERIDLLRTRIADNLNHLANEVKLDENRLHQEMIYYIEKFDITEEKVRLANHCNYFRQETSKPSCGRKLGFISQEIGREINTLGSKANHARIQQLVVQMKDELEKIKEQLLNVL